MRIPDPKANTTTEAYLAYKAGYLEESELKPKLYEPYLHFDAWLAYWAGLTNTYPIKKSKNIFNINVTRQDPSNTATANTNNRIFTSGTYCVGIAASNYYYERNVVEYSISDGVLSVENRNVYGVGFAISLEPGTYNLSYTGAANARAGVGFYSNDGSYISGITTDVRTFTVPDNASMTVIVFYSSTAETATFSNIQLEVGSSATSYEPYTRRPEMLCDEEALVAYLSGVTDTYPEEIKDPYDVRIVGYLKHLVSARWPEPDYPVNNEEFYLSTMKPPVVPSGDTPSSDIEMDDTAEAPFIDLKMYGDTSQNTCAGDQLLTKQGFATPITDTNFWGSFAQSKLKHTPLADGWAELEVKETSGSVFGDMNINQEGVKGFAASTTYTMIVEIKDKSGAGTDGDNMKNLCLMQPNSVRDAWDSSSVNIVQGAIWTGGTNVVVTLADSDWTSRTAVVVATTKEDLTNVFSCRFFTRPGVPAGTSFKIRVSVLAGDHSSDWQNYAGDNYQPYVGGIPAPNPEYPQNVQTVTGEQTVMVTGRNLLDEQTMQQGSFNFLTGVEATDSRRIRSTFIECKPNTNYNLSANVGLGEFAVIYKAQDGTIIAGEGASTNEQSYSFTSDANAYYMRIRVGNGPYPKTTEGNYGLMLAEGSVPTTYEPYQSQSYEINLGKNLFDVNGDFTYGGYSNHQTTKNGDGTITTSSNFSISRCSGQKLNLLANTTYTLSCNMTATTSTQTNKGIIEIMKGIRNVNMSVVARGFATTIGEMTFTFTTPEDVSEIWVNFNSNGAATSTFADIQIEQGSTATTYAPYFEPIELCKIGDYQDYIYKSDDEWYIHKACGKQIVNTSDITLKGTYTNVEYAVYPKPQDYAGVNSYDYVALISTHVTFAKYPPGGDWNSANGIGKGWTGASRVDLWIGFAKGTGLDVMKTKLAGCINYYALGTPTDTKITDAELISQLDALMEGGSYEDKTFIKVTATDPNLPGLLYVEAGKNV